MIQIEILLLQVIRSAAEGNREGVLQKSIKMKFLTGFESKVKKKQKTHEHERWSLSQL